MAIDPRLTSLKNTRPQYEHEARQHRLYLDAFSGGGGFSGSVAQNTSDFWGPSAALYDHLGAHYDSVRVDDKAYPIKRHTYLNRFARESKDKFIRRIDAAHYSNYIQPLTLLKLGYVFDKEFTVQDRPTVVEQWRENMDGKGAKWEQMLLLNALRAAVIGWVPVLIDMPPAPVDDDGNPIVLNRATANQLGIMPTAVPLFPANLLDYELDDGGNFVWAVIRTDHQERETPFDEVTNITRYTVWYADRYSIYEDVRLGTGQQEFRVVAEDSAHVFERVPIAILRSTPVPDDPIKGLPMHGTESMEAKAHFNRQSEFIEHLRGTVFAMLVVATDSAEDISEIVVGPENAIALDPNSSQSHYFLSPEGSVAETFEKRLEKHIEEIYRQARVEFGRPTASRAAVSGQARKFEFAQTDKALRQFAQQIATFEEEIDTLIGLAYNLPYETASASTVTAPMSFDVDDLVTDLDAALVAVQQLDVGPTAAKLIRERIVQGILPNLPKSDMDAVRSELEGMEEERLQERATAAAVQAFAGFGAQDDENEEPADEQ